MLTAPTNTQKHDHRERVRVYSPYPPAADHPTCSPSPSSLKCRLHSFMKWKISTQVILRRGEGFNEQELLYFVVSFESAD